MRLLLFLLLSKLSLTQTVAYTNMLNEYYSDFPTISCEEAHQLTGKKNVYFLDTREKVEFEVSHIQHAIWVGYNDFNIDRVKFIPQNALIIVYCSIGARSQTIGEKLVNAGYTKVQNLYGGLFHWSNLGYEKYNQYHRKTDHIHGCSKEWAKWIEKGTIVY